MPILEYVRQLNQQSVTLKSEWLERLQYVECSSGEFSIRPEIALAGTGVIRSSDSREHAPPVTLVTPNPDRKPGQNAWASDARVSDRLQAPDRIDSQCYVINAAAPAYGAPGMQVPIDAGMALSADLQDSIARAAVPELDRAVIERMDAAHAFSGKSSHLDFPEARRETVLVNQMTASQASPSILSTAIPDSTSWGRSSKTPELVLAREPRGTSPVSAGSASPPAGPGVQAIADRGTRPERTRCRISESDRKRVDHRQGSQATAIEQIADQILQRFPPVSPTTILLASLHGHSASDSISARLASCLALRDAGRILLIDGNAATRELSVVMGTAQCSGLAEMVSSNATVDEIAGTTDNGKLDFLSFGRGDLTWRKLEPRKASDLVRQFNESYQFSIISGGSIHDPMIQLWSSYIDALYLLVELEHSDRQQVQCLVQQLHRKAIRLAGLIAIEET